jgi:isocitrate lyase
MTKEIELYNNNQTIVDKEICDLLAKTIDNELTEAESKIWHSHPVWFLSGNPTVGYSKQKKGIRLMFWSGADFGEEKLNGKGEKFKDASIFYNNSVDIDLEDVTRWLNKSRKIQWDYKNIVKRKGKLERIN